MGVCPCKGCVPPKRTLGCHGKCKEYIEWREKYEKEKNNENLGEEIDRYYTSKKRRRRR